MNLPFTTTSKAALIPDELADFVKVKKLKSGVERFFLVNSNIPVLMVQDYISDGLSNEEIASMIDCLTTEDVAKVHTFISSIL